MTSPAAPDLSALLARGLIQRGSDLEVPPGPHTDRSPVPVHDHLADLLPDRGLRPGTTVAVTGSTALLLLTIAAAGKSGKWVAVVGIPDLCPLAAHELGADLSRLAVIPHPGERVAGAVDALLGGVAIIVVGTSCLPAGARGAALARKMASRARHYGTVLIPYTRDAGSPWPAPDLTLTAGASQYSGLEDGYGRIRGHSVEVTLTGRGIGRPVTETVVVHPEPERWRPTGPAVPEPRRRGYSIAELDEMAPFERGESRWPAPAVQAAAAARRGQTFTDLRP